MSDRSDFLSLFLSALRTLAGSFAMTLAVAKFGSDLAPARRAAILWSCVLSMATVVVLAHAVFRDVRDPERTDPRSVSPYARRVCDAAANGFLALSAGITIALAVFAYRHTLPLFSQ